MKKVTTIVLNDFTNDSRVLKENLTLKNSGFEVEILALHNKKGLELFEEVEGIPVYRLNASKRNLPPQEIEVLEEVKSVEPIDTSDMSFTYKVLRKAKRLIVKVLKKTKRIIAYLKRYRTKFLNKFFKWNRIKFNLLFAKRCKDSDIVHCNDILTLPMGVLAKKFYNKDIKIVYDAHEYETETNGLTGKKKKWRKFLEKSLIKYADKVITVSDAIANEYVRLYAIKKPVLVLNTPSYVDLEKKNIFREKFGITQEQTIFLYQGSLAKGRGIENILALFSKDIDENSVIVFMGFGYFEEEIKKFVSKYENIFFHPAVSPKVLLNYTSSADFGISTIEDICLSYRYSLPNKMFEYIMAEVPVIVSDLPEMKRIVEDYQVGVVATSNSGQGLIDAIQKATQMDKAKLNANIKKAKKIFNWEEQEKVLLKVYNELV